MGGAAEESTINIEEGAHVSALSTTLRSNGRITISGTDASGNPSTWTNASNLTLGTSGPTAVDIQQGALLITDSATIGFGDDGSGNVRVGSVFSNGVSTWTNTTDLSVGGSRTSAWGQGTIDVVRNGLVDVGGTLKIWERGSVQLNRGRIVADTIDNTEGGEFDFVAGKLEVDSFRGDLVNQGGTLQANVVSGNLLNQGGVLAPGPGAGNTTIGGDFTQQSDATVAIDIGGLAAGSAHDLVGIGGTAVLDGELQVSLINGFVPDASDVFTPLGASHIVGVFDNVATRQRLATTDGSGSFVVQYGLGSAFDEDQLAFTNFLATGALLGDFNDDGSLDAADIDLLTGAVDGSDLAFDITYDGKIDGADRRLWVTELKNTYFGDADLDGDVDAADLNELAVRWRETGNLGWADGDFDGSGAIDAADLNALGTNWQSTSAPQASAVPEPATGWSLGLLGCLVFLQKRLRRR